MKHLGGESGRGDVEIKGEIVGSIDYTLDVWTDGNFKSATGRCTGRDVVIAAIFNAGRATLHLKEGGTAEFMITNAGFDGGDMRFSGPIPGY